MYFILVLAVVIANFIGNIDRIEALLFVLVLTAVYIYKNVAEINNKLK